MSVDSSVSADSQVRRRIVSAPRRTVAPLAVITRDPQGVATLVEKLKLTRPVVMFPSLAHFCTNRQRAERWAGIIIGQACAWDARLDQYVVDRDCIALFGEDEGYGWPDAVYRLHTGDLDTWIGQLDAPRIPVPVVRTREKRAPKEGGETRAKRSRSVFTLWSPDRVVTVDAGASSTGTSTNGSEATNTAAQSSPPEARVSVSRTYTTREPVKKRVPEQQTLPFVGNGSQPSAKKGRAASQPVEVRGSARSQNVEVRGSARSQNKVSEPARTKADKSEATRAAMRDAAEREAKAWSLAAQSPRGKASKSRAEENLMRLAAEIGFVHARSLLDKLRLRALEVVR